MIDYIGIVKFIELKAEADRVRWQRNEDAYYEDFAHAPDIDSGLRKLLGLFRPKSKMNKLSRRDGKSAAPSVAHRCCQAAARL